MVERWHVDLLRPRLDWLGASPQLWRVHPDGTGNSPYAFTETSSAQHSGMLSPDGKYLLYITGFAAGQQMYVLNMTTGVTTLLTSPRGRERSVVAGRQVPDRHGVLRGG